MKKSVKYLGILFAFILVITGCGKKDPKGTLEKAIDKTSKAESMHQKIALDLGMSAEGVQVNYAVALEGDAIQKEDSFKAHYNYSLTVYGFGVKGEIYADINKESVALYFQTSGKWYKVETKIDTEQYEKIKAELEKQVKDNDKIDILKYAKSVKEVKSDKKGYTKLSVVFDKDKINADYKEGFNKALEEYKNNKDSISESNAEEIDSALNELEENDLYNSIKDGLLSDDISFDIYVKDGYVSYFEYDLKTIIDNIIKKINVPSDIKSQIDELNLSAKMTVELSNFNKVSDITVPDSVKESAVDYTKASEDVDNKIARIDAGEEVE